jgi:DNA polymerase-3 subunit gamma/tau
MSEQSTSLYRRHRPQAFADVVGQEHVVKTLSNAIEGDRVHHAYLFVGSRGTGKTSMAKILARSLNCEQGPTLTPCGKCEACMAIERGNSMDVIEMDAASNRSVDDIRELRDRVGYAPAEGHWKVYILDEAHMLTKEAWNAFLKTLEEPPPNTVFVLATTEPQKVMPTIADRCQRFDFQRPSPEQIGEVVERVAASEKISIDDAAVNLVARAAGGSFRDALGTLDQLVAFGGDSIDGSAVADLLGAADADLIFEVTDALGAGDAKGTLESVEKLSSTGRDPSRFAADLVAHLRQLLVCKTTGGIPASFTVTAADPSRLAAQAEALGEAKLVGAIDVLSNAISAMRAGDDPRFSLEIALLRIAEPRIDPSREALSRRIEDLESRLGQGAPVPTPTAPPAAPTPKAETSKPPAAKAPAEDPVEPSSKGEAEVESAPKAEAVSEPQPMPEQAVEVTVEMERVTSLWPAVVEHVRESRSEMVSTLFHGARPIAVDSEKSVVRIGFPPSSKFNKRKIESDQNAAMISESLQAVFGAPLRPVFELVEEEDEDGTPAPAAPDQMDEGEVVDMLMDEFDAEEISADAAAAPDNPETNDDVEEVG